MPLTLLASLFLGLIASTARAQSTCGPGTLCPASAPCCSEYGFCGSGTSCLGGCNPLHSYSLTSCTPEPICEDESITFPNMDRILTNSTDYDGNATLHDFVVDSGTAFVSTDSELVLTLTQSNNGTRISSTRYVHYATISAQLKTARTAGVVNAFITMSDVKDEIDWEWPGNQTTEAQTNYFWLGVANYTHTNGETENGLSDTFSNYHNYTIDWQEDRLTWLIDGTAVRTLNKEDTLSPDGSYYMYPSTPARVQLSIWPAGIPSSAPGTVQWAGGMIPWNDPDYVAQGHYSIIIKSVSIQCAPETAQTVTNTGALPPDPQSYVYTKNDSSGHIPQVFISNESTNVNAAFATIRGVTFGFAGVTALAVVLSMFGFMI